MRSGLCRAGLALGKLPWLRLIHSLDLAWWGAYITWVAQDRFWLWAGGLSGFLGLAPGLATSLYAMSRAIERKEAVNLRLLIKTWTQWQTLHHHGPVSYWCLVRFGVLLALAGTGWVVTSSALTTLMAVSYRHLTLPMCREEFYL